MRNLCLYPECQALLVLVVCASGGARCGASRVLQIVNHLVLGARQVLKVIFNEGPQRKSLGQFVEGRIHAERQPETVLGNTIGKLGNVAGDSGTLGRIVILQIA